jgi:hypothetical protein
MENKMKITVEKRSEDYMAFVNDDRRIWGCGKSPQEAIGDVIMSHVATIGMPDVEMLQETGRS